MIETSTSALCIAFTYVYTWKVICETTFLDNFVCCSQSQSTEFYIFVPAGGVPVQIYI